MKKIILLCGLLFFCGCSVTIVYVEKNAYGNHNDITGSELDGNTASQSASGELDIPIP